MTTKVITPVEVTTSNTAKATGKIVAAVSDFAAVKAEIARLEKIKADLSATITEAFGDASVLVHRNIEIARLDTRTRKSTDEALLAEAFPEAYEATRRTSTYKVIVNIYQ